LLLPLLEQNASVLGGIAETEGRDRFGAASGLVEVACKGKFGLGPVDAGEDREVIADLRGKVNLNNDGR
jgi:hypothetical protein